jgi:hypothetical protein
MMLAMPHVRPQRRAKVSSWASQFMNILAANRLVLLALAKTLPWTNRTEMAWEAVARFWEWCQLVSPSS